jgi:hypothetical protein
MGIGQGAKCSGTNRGLFHSQACTFPEESFILSSSCNSVGIKHSRKEPSRQVVNYYSEHLHISLQQHFIINLLISAQYEKT